MWSEPDSLPQLDRAEAHLWLVDTRQGSPDISLLSEDERRRCWRFQSDTLRERYVYVHNVLHRLLGHYLNQPPDRIVFTSNPYGKPHLDLAGLPFNLSYSQHLALLAFCPNGSIGVDIERIQPIEEMEDIAARWFSLAERQAWYSLQPEERLSAFYRVWTCKEAVIKALGMGLSYPLQQFTVPVTPFPSPVLIKIEEHTLQLLDLSPDIQFAGALAHEKPDLTLKCWRWKT